jgi:hypothetical protein
MKLTIINRKPVIERAGKKQNFKDYEAVIRHINRFKLADKVENLHLLPVFYQNRLDPVPSFGTVFKMVLTEINEAHKAQLLTLS